MKKLINFIIIIFALGVFSGCDDFLDTQSYTQKNSETFPKTEADADQLLTGVYAVMNEIMSGNPNASYFMVSELASDDRFGGGGINDKQLIAVNHLLYSDANLYSHFWEKHYLGVARANGTIAALDVMEEGDLKNQKIGEGKILRAYFYFELVQFLGDVPLMKASPETVDDALESPLQAPQKEIFQQIGTDLWDAYSMMPSLKWNDVKSGTATKWVAAGLLARAWLFYTGFYGETTLPTDDGQITKDQVVAALKDCIDNSGHSLLPDFRSLWNYTNSESKKDYPYAADAPNWVMDGLNPEQVFVVKHIGFNGWSDILHQTNQFALFFGIRNEGAKRYESVFPLGQGWGAGPVNSNLWTQWAADEPTDPRRKASIYNVEDEATNYFYGADKQAEETGLWQKKVIAITAKGKGGDPEALYSSFFSTPAYEGYTGDDFQAGNASDIALIRYADILLMHSEVSGTADGMNQVRSRVGLAPVAYSLAAIQKERRYELAFEGLRWGDIRRWGIAEQVLGKMYGVKIWSEGRETTMKPQGSNVVDRYKATKGFFMIPQTEIDLANGALKQNAGWDPSFMYSSFVE